MGLTTALSMIVVNMIVDGMFVECLGLFHNAVEVLIWTGVIGLLWFWELLALLTLGALVISNRGSCSKAVDSLSLMFSVLPRVPWLKTTLCYRTNVYIGLTVWSGHAPKQCGKAGLGSTALDTGGIQDGPMVDNDIRVSNEAPVACCQLS